MIESDLELPCSEQLMLLHELNHRIGNEFASIISIVSLAARRSGNEEVKAALTSVSQLLHKLVDVHRALRRPEHDTCIDAAAYLRKLCASISRSKLDHMKINLVFAASPVQLQSDHCWRLGMIVYELITNAAKHAFANGSGEIRVELLRAGAFVECRVLDNGSAPATVQPGCGLKLIKELARTLAGGVEQEFGAGGSRSILIFPRRTEPLRNALERTSQRIGPEVERSFFPEQEILLDRLLW
jgi:two-component sensor histidine kinase